VKALIVIADYEGLPDTIKATAMREELDHAAQGAISGTAAKRHLGGSVSTFRSHPAAKRAEASVSMPSFSDDGEAAAEISVRLMRQDGY
jgi:hypothetical protein